MLASAFGAFHYFSNRRAWRDQKSSSKVAEMMWPQSHVSWSVTRRFWPDSLLSTVLRAFARIQFVSFPDDYEAFMKKYFRLFMLSHLLLLHLNLQGIGFFVVFAPFILKPDANNPRWESRHLHELFFHQSIGAGICIKKRAVKIKITLKMNIN